jgi:hypothetical protein
MLPTSVQPVLGCAESMLLSSWYTAMSARYRIRVSCFPDYESVCHASGDRTVVKASVTLKLVYNFWKLTKCCTKVFRKHGVNAMAQRPAMIFGQSRANKRDMFPEEHSSCSIEAVVRPHQRNKSGTDRRIPKIPQRLLQASSLKTTTQVFRSRSMTSSASSTPISSSAARHSTAWRVPALRASSLSRPAKDLPARIRSSCR